MRLNGGGGGGGREGGGGGTKDKLKKNLRKVSAGTCLGQRFCGWRKS